MVLELLGSFVNTVDNKYEDALFWKGCCDIKPWRVIHVLLQIPLNLF